ncbi:hypothetical protein EPUS_08633 [Endocarpon pusillum Z07020]|uniref:Uncharacterized protein n=1 Tax=Endocarpon pusillum (strain Z07020 / HMAS-L-300199) TaxID=1263415 RepID=U1I1B4_ENDPU|nr:uncharacterized protein EPUS_08633 [Endocarpon pusillum Z07020]ERF75679.1 hypothetical protein EPUS_08633 [Endocarpon pusillum Z07020]
MRTIDLVPAETVEIHFEVFHYGICATGSNPRFHGKTLLLSQLHPGGDVGFTIELKDYYLRSSREVRRYGEITEELGSRRAEDDPSGPAFTYAAPALLPFAYVVAPVCQSNSTASTRDFRRVLRSSDRL